jgi:hypothetical protein
MFNNVRRERETRLVKKDRIRATYFSIVVLILFSVSRGIITSLYTLIGVSKLPASTISLSAAGAF